MSPWSKIEFHFIEKSHLVLGILNFLKKFWTISPTSKDLTSWCLLGQETEYIFKYILGKVNQLVMKLEPVTYSHGKYFQKKFCQYALRWYFEGMH